MRAGVAEVHEGHVARGHPAVGGVLVGFAGVGEVAVEAVRGGLELGVGDSAGVFADAKL